NISYAGNGASDHIAIIDVLRSAVVLFPGYSAMVTDGNGSYSPIKNVKDGLSYHSVIPGTERWGDYSGSQRKYDEPGKVWVNGSYATLSHKVATWISEISLDPISIGINEPINSSTMVNAFPNPFSDKFEVSFMVGKSMNCSFDLFDMNGKLTKILMQERVQAGTNQFSFSLSPVPKGMYLFVISANGRRIAAEKLIKD
ncbi:MAG: T9SS type A sorting domain-containing protein, partial [Chitinophagales bacterium]|nr:T9SS type A sorting domain-containing protein [Chitinophagales bacterium]